MHKTQDHFYSESYNYPGKPYSQFPVKVKGERKLKSVQIKCRNIGLQNSSINTDNYHNINKTGHIEAVRKLGKNYQKNLQKKFDSLRIYESKSMARNTANY